MSFVKRLRIFAGPNGSGKSSLYTYLVAQGYFTPYFYINADQIALSLPTGFSVLNWPCKVSQDDFLHFLDSCSLSNLFDVKQVARETQIEDNVFLWAGSAPSSYVAAAIADYLREKMLTANSSFACETVFSHPSKLEFMKRAKENGFKVYLYFIAAKDPFINEGRVANRALNGGHDVPPEKVHSRFYRCMDNLFCALKVCDEAYLFDNSSATEKLSFDNFALFKGGVLKLFCDIVPAWFDTYVLQKIAR